MLFSDESPFNSSWFVRGTSVDQLENVLMRNAPYQQWSKPFNQMIWGAMSRNDVAALSFLPPETTMNELKYVQMLSKKLKLHLQVHNCQIFMQDGTPCHSSKVAKNLLDSNNIGLFEGQQTVRIQIPSTICGPT